MSRSETVSFSPQFKHWIEEASDLELKFESQDADAKARLYDKMANELLSKNIPKEKVYTTIHKFLQDNIRKKKKDPKYVLNNSWLYEYCQKNGWTKSSYPNSSTLKQVEESKPFAPLRNLIINVFSALQLELEENKKIIRADLPETTWQKFFDDESETKNLFDQIMSMCIAEIDDAKRDRDSRQIILPTDRFMLMALKCFVSDKWYGKKHHTIVKEKSKLSGKKIQMFLDDPWSISKLIYHCMIDPLNLHFLDIPCPKCDSTYLKTFWNIDGTWQIVCTNEQAHNDKKEFFPASLITDTLQKLRTRESTSTQFLKQKGIPVPSNEPRKRK